MSASRYRLRRFSDFCYRKNRFFVFGLPIGRPFDNLINKKPKTNIQTKIQNQQPKTQQPKTLQPKTLQPKTLQPKTLQPKTQLPKTQLPKTQNQD